MSFQVFTATCRVTTSLGRTCFQVFLIEGEWDVDRFSVTVHAMTLQSVQAHIHTHGVDYISTQQGGEMLFFKTYKQHNITVNLELTWINTAECVRASLSMVSTLDVGTTPGS